jgi:hypothetical protein
MSKAESHPLIEPFLDALWLERGLSDNTVSSYRTDLEKFALWLDEQGGSLLLAGLDDIQHYLAWRVDHQFAASSTARFLSALRRFYQYLNREKLRSDDPTVLLEGPKLPKKLPSDLSEAEVEALLQAPLVNYTANPTLMIQRSLNPAKVSSITIDEEKMTASVYLKPDQVSLAIGKGGLNIRLSKMLTGYDIDVYREVEEEDVALTEFADEIDGWVIDALKAAGCDTAKSVLELPVEEIAARADLELEQAQKVVEILKAEFE